MLEFSDKDFKIGVTNIFKKLKENMVIMGDKSSKHHYM